MKMNETAAVKAVETKEQNINGDGKMKRNVEEVGNAVKSYAVSDVIKKLMNQYPKSIYLEYDLFNDLFHLINEDKNMSFEEKSGWMYTFEGFAFNVIQVGKAEASAEKVSAGAKMVATVIRFYFDNPGDFNGGPYLVSAVKKDAFVTEWGLCDFIETFTACSRKPLSSLAYKSISGFLLQAQKNHSRLKCNNPNNIPLFDDDYYECLMNCCAAKTSKRLKN